MKCLHHSGNTSMKENTIAPLTGGGETHGGGARVITLATLKNVLLWFKNL